MVHICTWWWFCAIIMIWSPSNCAQSCGFRQGAVCNVPRPSHPARPLHSRRAPRILGHRSPATFWGPFLIFKRCRTWREIHISHYKPHKAHIWLQIQYIEQPQRVENIQNALIYWHQIHQGKRHWSRARNAVRQGADSRWKESAKKPGSKANCINKASATVGLKFWVKNVLSFGWTAIVQVVDCWKWDWLIPRAQLKEVKPLKNQSQLRLSQSLTLAVF